MPCEKRITVIEQTKVIGSNGTVIWFIPFRQYCYDDIVSKELDCKACHAGTQGREDYYRIIINGEDFDLPAHAGAAAIYPQSQEKQDVRKWVEKQVEQPKDMYKVTKELLDIDIDAGNTVVHNGYELSKQAKRQSEVGSDS